MQAPSTTNCPRPQRLSDPRFPPLEAFGRRPKPAALHQRPRQGRRPKPFTKGEAIHRPDVLGTPPRYPAMQTQIADELVGRCYAPLQGYPPYEMALASVKCPPAIWWTPDDDGSGIKRDRSASTGRSHRLRACADRSLVSGVDENMATSQIFALHLAPKDASASLTHRSPPDQ